MNVQFHEIVFHRNANTGLHRALCTCGWVSFGTQAEVQQRASVHDLNLEWEAVEPQAAVQP